MQDNHEVISAFIDGESFEPDELATALSDPEGRRLLIDLLALRHLAQVDGPVPAAPRYAGRRMRVAIAAAALLVALVGGYRWGARTAVGPVAPPEPTRVITNVGEWQGGAR